MTLTDHINAVLSEWGCDAKEVNAGRCEDFANAVLERMGDPEDVQHDIFPGRPSGTHSYLKHKGRYYDAESPEGVDKVRDLPVIQRWLSSLEGALKTQG